MEGSVELDRPGIEPGPPEHMSEHVSEPIHRPHVQGYLDCTTDRKTANFV